MEFLNWYQVKQSIGIKSFEKRYSSSHLKNAIVASTNFVNGAWNATLPG